MQADVNLSQATVTRGVTPDLSRFNINRSRGERGNLDLPEKWMFIDNRRFGGAGGWHFVASKAFTTLMGVNVSRNGVMMKLYAELIFHKQNHLLSQIAFSVLSWGGGCALSG